MRMAPAAFPRRIGSCAEAWTAGSAAPSLEGEGASAIASERGDHSGRLVLCMGRRRHRQRRQIGIGGGDEGVGHLSGLGGALCLLIPLLGMRRRVQRVNCGAHCGGGSLAPARRGVVAARSRPRRPCQWPGSRLASAERRNAAWLRELRLGQRARVIYHPYAVQVTVNRLSLADSHLTPARAARALGTRYRLRAGSTALLAGRSATASLVVALLAFAPLVLRLPAGYPAAAVQTTDGSRSLPTRCARRAALGRNRGAAESRCSAARLRLALAGGRQ